MRISHIEIGNFRVSGSHRRPRILQKGVGMLIGILRLLRRKHRGNDPARYPYVDDTHDDVVISRTRPAAMRSSQTDSTIPPLPPVCARVRGYRAPPNQAV